MCAMVGRRGRRDGRVEVVVFFRFTAIIEKIHKAAANICIDPRCKPISSRGQYDETNDTGIRFSPT